MHWVVGGTLYGNSPGVCEAIHHHGRRSLLAIGVQHQVIPAERRQAVPLTTLVAGLPEADWERLCFRVGEKSLVWYEW